LRACSKAMMALRHISAMSFKLPFIKHHYPIQNLFSAKAPERDMSDGE
jgi:hypothetical protein